jgi:DedD protein
MGRLLDSNLDMQSDGPESGQDHEISLGMSTVLGIFFLLALICAGFFGFGYTLGRKSSLADVTSTTAVQAAASSTAPRVGKPSAGSVVVAATSEPSVDAPAAAPASLAGGNDGAKAETPTAPVAAPAPAEPAPAPKKASITDFLGPAKPAAPAPVAKTVQAPGLPAKPAAKQGTLVPAQGVSGNFMVQIAAVSSQEIADIELVALKKKGYNVVVRHEPQDQLLHIQVGPFANRKDAEDMRQRILGDGFNAIIKP